MHPQIVRQPCRIWPDLGDHSVDLGDKGSPQGAGFCLGEGGRMNGIHRSVSGAVSASTEVTSFAQPAVIASSIRWPCGVTE